MTLAAASLLDSIVRATALVALATATAWAMDGTYSIASQAMAYLLVVVFAAFRFGLRDSVLAAVLGVASLNFFFVPPRYTFVVESPDYLVLLCALLLVSLVVSGLAARLRAETAQALLRERRARELHALADALADAQEEPVLLARTATALAMAFGPTCAMLLPDAGGRLQPVGSDQAARFDPDAARWAFDRNRAIGPTTGYWPELPAWYVPVRAEGSPFGVVVLSPGGPAEPTVEDRLHVEAFARQIGLALQRARLAQSARVAAFEAHAESVRNALLASISHDLRTPLAAILGAAGTLAGQREKLSEDEQRALLRSIEDEARQMTASAENILQFARLSSGPAVMHRDWESAEEIAGAVVGRFRRRGVRQLQLQVAAGLPLVRVDAVLVAQVLSNLVENALRYAPAGSPITVSAGPHGDGVLFAVADRGPGLADEDATQLFAKFRRGRGVAHGGAGLGLAICKAIVELHDGHITARDREGGGTVFEFSLPRGGEMPAPPVAGTGNA